MISSFVYRCVADCEGNGHERSADNHGVSANDILNRPDGKHSFADFLLDLVKSSNDRPGCDVDCLKISIHQKQHTVLGVMDEK